MDFTELEKKLIRLALDPGAIGNEIDNSVRVLFKSLRDRKVRASDFLNGTGTNGRTAEFDYGNVIIPLKKHKGKTIRQVAEEDVDYLLWVVENVDSKPLLVRQITTYLQQKFGL